MSVTPDQHYAGVDRATANDERGEPSSPINIRRVPAEARLANETTLAHAATPDTFALVNRCICGCLLTKIEENRQNIVNQLRYETYCDTCASRQPVTQVLIDNGSMFRAICCTCNNTVEKKLTAVPAMHMPTDAERDAGVVKSTTQFDYTVV